MVGPIDNTGGVHGIGGGNLANESPTPEQVQSAASGLAAGLTKIFSNGNFEIWNMPEAKPFFTDLQTIAKFVSENQPGGGGQYFLSPAMNLMGQMLNNSIFSVDHTRDPSGVNDGAELIANAKVNPNNHTIKGENYLLKFLQAVTDSSGYNGPCPPIEFQLIIASAKSIASTEPASSLSMTIKMGGSGAYDLFQPVFTFMYQSLFPNQSDITVTNLKHMFANEGLYQTFIETIDNAKTAYGYPPSAAMGVLLDKLSSQVYENPIDFQKIKSTLDQISEYI